MKVISVLNLARTEKMKRRLLEGHNFFGAHAAKTAHCDDDRSSVQDNTSYLTVGTSKVATESRQVSEIPAQPIVAAHSVANAAPAPFSGIGACWHGLTARGRPLCYPMPRILPDMEKLAVIEQHFLLDKNFDFPVRWKLMANSASSNSLGWKSSPGCYIQNPAMQVLFALPVFFHRTTRSWGNYIPVGGHRRTLLTLLTLLTFSLPVYATIHNMYILRQPHRFIQYWFISILVYCYYYFVA